MSFMNRYSLLNLYTPILFKFIEFIIIICIIIFYPMRPYAFVAKAIAFYGFPYVIVMLILGRVYDIYFDNKTETVICFLGSLIFLMAGAFTLFQSKHVMDPNEERGSFISVGIISIVTSICFLMDGVLNMFSYLESSKSQINSLIVTKILQLIGIIILICLHPALYTTLFFTTGTICGFAIAIFFLIVAFLCGVHVRLNTKLIILGIGCVLFLVCGCIFLMEGKEEQTKSIQFILYTLGGLSIFNGILFIIDSMLTAREVVY